MMCLNNFRNVHDIETIFEKLKLDGYNLVLLDCEEDPDYEDGDEIVYWIAFTDVINEESVTYQKNLLEKGQCSVDTVETWSSIDEMYTTIINEVRLKNENR